jgi:hypothetical protein
MAEARSGNCEANSACSKRKFGGNVVSESDDEKCKKKKFEAMNDFELVKILAEDARSKTLFLHLQSMCMSLVCKQESQILRNCSGSPQTIVVPMLLCITNMDIILY